jgi:integrase/recombinase XerD
MRKIYVRPKTEEGYRYQAVMLKRGIRTGDLHPPFYIRHRQQWHRLNASTFSEAKQEVEQATLEAKAKGITVGEAASPDCVSVRSAVDTYLAFKANRARKTQQQYELTLAQFVESLGEQHITFLDQITDDVLRRFKGYLERQGYAGKTIDTRINIVFFLLKKNGVVARVPKDEMPAIEIEDAVPYTDEELARLFGAMDAEDTLRYKFFLGSGCREQEVIFATWQDIDLATKTYTVRRKDGIFNPKTHESRTIPLPTSLVEALKARRKNQPEARWVFTGKEGRPEQHFLRKLKKIALRAGLNCGHCCAKEDGEEVTCKTHPVCENFILHRFRKTCATRWQQCGLDSRTIQKWLGHKSLVTTERYLGAMPSEKLRPNIDRAFGD